MDEFTKQKIINALNIQGVFFQEKSTDVFKKLGWEVITEYPVMFPRPAFGNFGKDGVIDIWARKKLRNMELHFLVECKKADPKLKEWIFFKDKEAYSTGNDSIKFTSGQNSKWATETSLIDLQNLTIETFKSEPRCFFGLEVREHFQKSPQKDDTKTTSQRISDACYQAVQATNGTFQELGEYYSKLQNTDSPKEAVTLLILSLVITTADLFIVDYKSSTIDDDGVVDAKNIVFEQKDVVLFNYPIPGHIRFSMHGQDIPKKAVQDRLGYKKTLVPIVNVGYLSDFLNQFK